MVLEMRGGKLVKMGKYKALATTHLPAGIASKELLKQEWQLFNLETDPGETTNLAKQEPQVLAQMIQAYDDYAKRLNVVEVSPTASPK